MSYSKQQQQNYNRIVIKIGSSLFSAQKSGVADNIFEQIVSQISHFITLEKEIVIVSSGAIALGMRKLGLKTRPKELASLQATAAIGQNALMDYYSQAFKKYKINCAQVLLTWDDFSGQRKLNAKNTLLKLLELGVVPIINENDATATDEIKVGDNDQLSALVASELVNADLLIILTDVDGLLNRNKEILRKVPKITEQVKALACSTDKQTSVGGMVTKIKAAITTTNSGLACVFANGSKQNIITEIVSDPASEGKWTFFLPQK